MVILAVTELNIFLTTTEVRCFLDSPSLQPTSLKHSKLLNPPPKNADCSEAKPVPGANSFQASLCDLSKNILNAQTKQNLKASFPVCQSSLLNYFDFFVSAIQQMCTALGQSSYYLLRGKDWKCIFIYLRNRFKSKLIVHTEFPTWNWKLCLSLPLVWCANTTPSY